MAAEIVEFRRRLPPYNVGERASFSPEHAERLVEKGIAVRARGPRGPATKEAAPPVIAKGDRVRFFVRGEGDVIGHVREIGKGGVLTIDSGERLYERVEPGEVQLLESAPVAPAGIAAATALPDKPAA